MVLQGGLKFKTFSWKFLPVEDVAKNETRDPARMRDANAWCNDPCVCSSSRAADIRPRSSVFRISIRFDYIIAEIFNWRHTSSVINEETWTPTLPWVSSDTIDWILKSSSFKSDSNCISRSTSTLGLCFCDISRSFLTRFFFTFCYIF